jgi:UDP-N-acetylmuramoyl-tripeptide--D-alanyl-D-alanine ligase
MFPEPRFPDNPMVYTLKNIAEIVNGHVVGDEGVTVTGFATDSRTVKPGGIFVALSGGRADGRDFVDAAAAAGASAALVANPVDTVLPYIVVEDALTALLSLAEERRERFAGRVIAVTGSCGKTTTKDFIAHVLRSRYRVCVSPKNYNTEIGLPLSVLASGEDDEILVVELGVSKPGDMRLLGNVAKPDVAVFTCIALTHIEFFKSVEAVAKEKLDLLSYLKDGATVVWNGDDKMLGLAKELKADDVHRISYGFSESNDVYAAGYKPEGFSGSSFLLNGTIKVELPIPGRFNVYNALAAVAVGNVLGVDFRAAAKVLRVVPRSDMRVEVIKHGGVTYILDCYNSSPYAAVAALDMLAESASGGRTVAVLGEMLELGDVSEEEHRRVGEHARESGINVLVGLGEGGRLIVGGAVETGFDAESTYVFETHEETAAFLADFLKEGDNVLFKASRGVEMELVAWELGLKDLR